MRPTTKDLAEAAGVSLATVDRVLNGRSGVRQKTINAVNAAIQEIGFERNQFAATLARRTGYRFAFILPKDGDEYLSEIIKRIEETKEAGRAEMLDIKVLRVDEHDPHKTARYLSRLKGQDYDGAAIMAPETPQIRDAILRMKERGILTIPFVSNQRDEDHHDFVGIDNLSAGRTVGSLMGRFTRPREGTIAILTDTMQARDSLERRLGFDEVINSSFQELTVLPTLETYGDVQRTYDIVRNVVSHQKELVGFYVMGSEARVPLEALSDFGDANQFVVIAHEKTPTTIQSLRADKLDAVVTQDPGHLVRSAVRILRSKCENRTTLASQEKIRIEILIKENL